MVGGLVKLDFRWFNEIVLVIGNSCFMLVVNVIVIYFYVFFVDVVNFI